MIYLCVLDVTCWSLRRCASPSKDTRISSLIDRAELTTEKLLLTWPPHWCISDEYDFLKDPGLLGLLTRDELPMPIQGVNALGGDPLREGGADRSNLIPTLVSI